MEQKRIHFIAIGGAVMHNLAIALHLKGYQVSGSDDEIFDPSKSNLQKYGLLPEEFGWFPEKLSDEIDEVILGMHARIDNPELIKAKELGLKIYSFPEYLYQQSKDKTRVVIGGSHGKTTITAMILHVLKICQLPSDYMVGARLEGYDVMVKISDADVMVMEGDEYLTSPIDRRPKFHLYKPHIALLSGIAWDHINVFPTFENYKEQFTLFIDVIEKGGKLVYCEDDLDLKQLVESHPRTDIELIPYSYPKFKIENGVSYIGLKNTFEQLSIIGKHNLLNLNGAMQVCKGLGIQEDDFIKSIQSFKGASNRLELLQENDHLKIFKDFAHAPSKLKATTESVKFQYPDKQLIACVELHTFSSLSSDFLDHYEACLDAADIPLVYFNPHAVAHKKLPDLDPTEVQKAFKNEKVKVFTDSGKLFELLSGHNMKNVCLLLMSSGNFNGIDINKFAEELVNR